MVVNEEDVVNIMAGMEHAGGIKLNDHKRKLKNRLNLNFFFTQILDRLAQIIFDPQEIKSRHSEQGWQNPKLFYA